MIIYLLKSLGFLGLFCQMAEPSVASTSDGGRQRSSGSGVGASANDARPASPLTAFTGGQDDHSTLPPVRRPKIAVKQVELDVAAAPHQLPALASLRAREIPARDRCSNARPTSWVSEVGLRRCR